MSKDVLTLSDAAEMLDLSVRAVKRMCTAHEIPYIVVRGKRRILRESLLDFLREQEIPAKEQIK